MKSNYSMKLEVFAMIEMLSAKEIESYLIFLKEQEKSKETIEKYKRELYDLLKFLSQKDLTKEVLILWKAKLQEHYRASSVNGKLVAANGFFSFLGRYDLRMKLLKIQKEIFSKEEKELTRQEYVRLVKTAKKRGIFAFHWLFKRYVRQESVSRSCSLLQ